MRQTETYLVSIDETARRRFEQARQNGDWTPLGSFLPGEADPRFLPTLEELVQVELEWVWRQGESRLATISPKPIKLVEGYLEQFPRLAEPAILLRLLAQEYSVRHKFGDRPSVASYRVRFPVLFQSDIDIDSLWKRYLQRSDRSSQRFAVGQTIDRYRLIEPHATGGFGVVWRAEDERLGRPVALKHLKASAQGSEELRQRFVNEARITAGLEHPGIVPIHDVGGLEEECPYYTMKFVRGETFSAAIKRFHQSRRGAPLDGRSIELLRLLNLFLNVVRTVQYAHANRVIHRDLKPQNILIGDYGETILLDWGLAREIKPPESEGAETVIASQLTLLMSADPLQTRGGAVMGTPSYMSPEQASGKTQEINELSDIYGLGAILYEILTGQAPFEGRSSDEVLEKVLAADLAPPRSIHPRLERGLESICLKAMAKDSRNRYAQVAALAEDIERWLADEPVRAHRDSLLQRWSRWSRRHRTWVRAAVALVALSAMVSTVAAYKINESRNQAESLADANGQLAIRNEHLADEAREHYELARNAVDQYLNAITDDERLKTEALEPLRRDLLQFALEFYEQLASRADETARSTDQEVLQDYATAHLRLASIELELGDTAAALESSASAIELLDRPSSDAFEGNAAAANLAMAHHIRAAALVEIGEFLAADQEYAEAIRRLRELADTGPSHANHNEMLIQSLRSRAGLNAQDTFPEGGDLNESALLLDEALQRCDLLMTTLSPGSESGTTRTRFMLAEVLSTLSYVQMRQQELDAAEATALRALEIRHQLLIESPGAEYLLSAIAIQHLNLGGLYTRMLRIAEGLEHSRRARDYHQQLADRHPDLPGHRADVASATLNIAQGLRDQADIDSALDEYHQAAVLFQAIAEEFPQSFDYWESWADTELMAGRIHLQRNELTEAIASFDAAVTAYRQIVDRVPHFRNRLALCEIQAGLWHNQAGDDAIAADLYAAADANYIMLMAENPAEIEFSVNRSTALTNLGRLHAFAGKYELAETTYQTAIDILQPELARHPDEFAAAQSLVNVSDNLAHLYAATDRSAEAEAAWRLAVEQSQLWLQRWPEEIALHASLADCYHEVAAICIEADRSEDALAACIEEENLRRHLLVFTSDTDSRVKTIEAIAMRVDLLFDRGELPECVERAEAGLDLCEEYLRDVPGHAELKELHRRLRSRLNQTRAGEACS